MAFTLPKRAYFMVILCILLSSLPMYSSSGTVSIDGNLRETGKKERETLDSTPQANATGVVDGPVTIPVAYDDAKVYIDNPLQVLGTLPALGRPTATGLITMTFQLQDKKQLLASGHRDSEFVSLLVELRHEHWEPQTFRSKAVNTHGFVYKHPAGCAIPGCSRVLLDFTRVVEDHSRDADSDSTTKDEDEDDWKTYSSFFALKPEFEVVSVNSVNGEGLDQKLDMYKDTSVLRDAQYVLHTKGGEFVELVIAGLTTANSYVYRILDADNPDLVYFAGRFSMPSKTSGSLHLADEGEFRLSIIADSHLFSKQYTQDEHDRDGLSEYEVTELQAMGRFAMQRMEQVVANINEERPDFVVQIGDPFDLHGLGFLPSLTFDQAKIAHKYARNTFALMNGAGAMYNVLGNWEGESSCHPESNRQAAIRARKEYQINPRPSLGSLSDKSSRDEDYYAFEWGSALFIVLNVVGYSPLCHELQPEGGARHEDIKYGEADDFTLGEAQQQFLTSTLKQSFETTGKYSYRFIAIHHSVGGNAGNAENSRYGRGGYRAISVGEQKWMHDVMRQYRVNAFFYGHDHVFSHEVIDSINYVLCGTTSAPWLFGRNETGYTEYIADYGHVHLHKTQDRAVLQYRHLDKEVLYESTIDPTPAWVGPLHKIGVSRTFNGQSATTTHTERGGFEVKWFFSLLGYSFVCVAVVYCLYRRLVLYGSRNQRKLIQKFNAKRGGVEPPRVKSQTPIARHRRNSSLSTDHAV